jgi:rSAM/selenodomain-associated transferase 1
VTPWRAVIVLARAPSVPGKTRLTASLTNDHARAFREALFLDTLAVARSAHEHVIVAYTPDDAVAEMAAYVGEAGGDAGPTKRVDRELLPALLPQRGDDLGARMWHAIDDAFSDRIDRVVLIGSDLPTLPSGHLIDAFMEIESGIDCVLGPADDGGYYLIGVKRGVDLAGLFTGIPWGTAGVLEATLAAARVAGLATGTIDSWFDVDSRDDLRRVVADPALSETRRGFYRRFLEGEAACGRVV